MVGGAARGQRGEEVVADAELLCIGPVGRNIGLRFLNIAELREFVHFAVIDGSESDIAAMAEVSTQRIGCVCLVEAVDSEKAAKDVIERVVFQHDDDNMLDRRLCSCHAMAVCLHSMKIASWKSPPDGYSEDDNKRSDEIPSVL